MSFKHNKKRNVGLLNEFFARYIARAIIEHRDSDLNKAKELFSKHFHKGTDLYRELKIFSVLFETKLGSREAAVSLIEQVKLACKLQSQVKSDLEKSALLHEINLTLGDPKFFDQEISEYRDYATIQVLLQSWRGNILAENLGMIAILEDKLIQHLTQSLPIRENKSVLVMTNEDVDGLVINIMTEKLNKKFNSALNKDQKKLLQLYVFSKENPQVNRELCDLLEKIRQRTLSNLETSMKTDGEVKKIEPKLLEVCSMLKEQYQNTSNPDDKMITFYMTISKLEEELSHE